MLGIHNFIYVYIIRIHLLIVCQEVFIFYYNGIMAEFIITFRETLEAALIVGIVMTFLVKHGYVDLLKQVRRAIVSALLGSVFFARVL